MSAITRWREDATRDDWGTYVFLRDVQSGEVWSAGYQPSGVEPDALRRHVRRRSCRVRPARRQRSPPRSMSWSRRRTTPKSVACPSRIPAAGRARSRSPPTPSSCWRRRPPTRRIRPSPSSSCRPSISPRTACILATRRRRSPGEPEIWAAHLAVVEGETVGEPEIETDRARFLGRGREVRTPMAVIDGLPLSNTVGTVLDPVFALRRRVRIPPGRTVRIAFWTRGRVLARRRAGSRRQASRRDRLRARRAPWRGPRRRCS